MIYIDPKKKGKYSVHRVICSFADPHQSIISFRVFVSKQDGKHIIMDIFMKAKEAATAVAGVAKQKGEELMHASMDTACKTKDSVMQTVNQLRGQPPLAPTTEGGGIAGPVGVSANNSTPNLSNTMGSNSMGYGGIPDPNAAIKPMTTTNIGGGTGGNFGAGYQSPLSGGFGSAAAPTQSYGTQGGTGPSY